MIFNSRRLDSRFKAEFEALISIDSKQVRKTKKIKTRGISPS